MSELWWKIPMLVAIATLGAAIAMSIVREEKLHARERKLMRIRAIEREVDLEQSDELPSDIWRRLNE